MKPFVSVVVPTRDGAATLADCVESLLAQSYPDDRYEIVVVDNGSTDGAATALPARFPRAGTRLRILALARPDANAARNAGIRAARGDPVCLVDDDVVAPPEWLSAIVAGLLRHGVDCAGGPIRPRFDARPPPTCVAHEVVGTSLDAGPHDTPVDEVWGGNMAITKRSFERTGPLREGLPAAHEWEWERRLLADGGRIVYVADAWLWHRRLGEDMRLARLVHRNLVHGWTVAALRASPGVGFRRIALRMGRSLRHWLTTGCTRGLTDAAQAAGLLAARLARR